MKTIKNILFLAMAVFALAACQDGEWETYEYDYAYGNDDLQETNVVTIAKLKSMYATVLSTDYRDGGSFAEVTEDLKIEGVVTGNDLGGNLYNQVVIEDATGAIIVAISQGGLNGYLPVGQKVLISLKGLCVGNYGKQPEIGVPYTNNNNQTYVSRMSRILWNQHFRLINPGVLEEVTPTLFNKDSVANEAYVTKHCGKLMRIKDVEFADADGVAVYAEGTTTNQALKNLAAKNIVVRTSNYADFAAKTLPKGTVTITGVFTQFNGTWQILMRTEDDIQK